MQTRALLELKDAGKKLLNGREWEASITFVSYGLHITICTNEPTILTRLANYLPPGWQPSSSTTVDKSYSLVVVGISQDTASIDHHLLLDEQSELARSQELQEIFEILDLELRLWLGVSVPDRLFVHAGVVGWRNQAIIIPGRSFSGKTTLVAALVEAGASYYSDEYAVFDTDGLVHPYPRPLSIRQESGKRRKRCPVEELGGKAGTEAIPIGLIVNTQYRPEAQWSPSPISQGQAVLALLNHTLVARLRPDFALPILACAVPNALTLAGDRPQAQETAVAILQQLEAAIK
jgi:hypothetical protein